MKNMIKIFELKRYKKFSSTFGAIIFVNAPEDHLAMKLPPFKVFRNIVLEILKFIILNIFIILQLFFLKISKKPLISFRMPKRRIFRIFAVTSPPPLNQ